MDQLRKFFGALNLRQRLTMLAVAVLAIAGLLSVIHWNRERDFKPLYSDLAPEDAGAVLAKLRESGVEYRVADGNSTISVPSARVAEVRLQLAGAGIPKSGRIGFELFDKTNLGTTDFAEQVNYHRAIEGEVERSLMAMSEVEQARVHITFPKDSVFTENREPAKASVMLKLRLGSKISPQNAAAISQLIASAVQGLTPEAVSVMDMQGNLLLRPKKPGDGSEPSQELIEYKQRLERETLAKINSVLDPLLGSEKYRASVDLDCDLTSGEQSEETFDPTRSVMTSSQRTEEGSLSRDSGGVPGTQSNLPRPTSRPAVQGGSLARRSENTNYETSRTVRRIKLPQGIVHRMSVSVLVDQNLRWEVAGKGANAHPKRIIEPPSPERMKSIQSVVGAAVGLNASRGDLLVVETLPFEATLRSDPPASLMPAPPVAPTPQKLPLPMPILAGIAGGVVLLMVLAIVMVRRSRKAAKSRLAEMQAQLGAAQAALEHSAPAEAALGANALKDKDKEAISDARQKQIDEVVEAFKLPPLMTTKTEILTRQVAEEAQKDPVALAQIIRTWLNEPAP